MVEEQNTPNHHQQFQIQNGTVNINSGNTTTGDVAMSGGRLAKWRIVLPFAGLVAALGLVFTYLAREPSHAPGAAPSSPTAPVNGPVRTESAVPMAGPQGISSTVSVTAPAAPASANGSTVAVVAPIANVPISSSVTSSTAPTAATPTEPSPSSRSGHARVASRDARQRGWTMGHSVGGPIQNGYDHVNQVQLNGDPQGVTINVGAP